MAAFGNNEAVFELTNAMVALKPQGFNITIAIAIMSLEKQRRDRNRGRRKDFS
jgi:hypothetical protein